MPVPVARVVHTCLVVLSWPILLAGCATGFTGSNVQDFGSFRIDVTNDLSPRVEIYLQVDPGDGGEVASQELLGNAPVEGTTVFRVEIEDPGTPHRLRAALPRNQEVVSETFVPEESASVRWVLAENVITPEDGDEAGPDAEASDLPAPAPGHRRPTGARIIPPTS